MKKIVLSAALLLSSIGLQAQQKSTYNQYDLFHPLFNYTLSTPSRSGTGAPGSAYWQNQADYKISVNLDDEKNTLEGEVEITYKNASPDKLNFLWLQLDQNQFSDKSRATAGIEVAYTNDRNLTIKVTGSLLTLWENNKTKIRKKLISSS